MTHTIYTINIRLCFGSYYCACHTSLPTLPLPPASKPHCYFDIAAPLSTPTYITSLISTCSDQLTVTWTSVPTATSYNVSINDSVNTLVPIPSTGAPQYTFTGLTNNTVYTVSVVAINCAGSSSPATMTGRTGETNICICMTSNNVNASCTAGVCYLRIKFDIMFA